MTAASSVVVITGTFPLETSAVKRSATPSPRARAASAVASASTVVPRSASVAVAFASPLMVTVAFPILSLMAVTMSSRFMPVTSIPPIVVPGTAMSW